MKAYKSLTERFSFDSEWGKMKCHTRRYMIFCLLLILITLVSGLKPILGSDLIGGLLLVADATVIDVSTLLSAIPQDTEVLTIEESLDRYTLMVEPMSAIELSSLLESVSEAVLHYDYRATGYKEHGFAALQMALLVVVAVFFIYLMISYSWFGALSAVGALLLDITVVLAILVLLQLEINLMVVGALLAILGYSVNDSVVMLDRFHAYKASIKPEERAPAVFLSILPRTVLTSMSTVLIVLPIGLFGGPAFTGFAIALVLGVAVGTLSSIVVLVLNAKALANGWVVIRHHRNQSEGQL